MPNSESEHQSRALRIEAGPARWGEFDSAQREAFIRIAEMIEEAVLEMPPAHLESGLLDRARRTRTAFLAGGRGTGKTTVLTSLRRHSRPESFSDDSTLPPVSGMDDRWRRAENLIKAMRGRVIWLETLDMEPLPENTNLIAAILMRVEDATRRYGEGPTKVEPRGLVDPGSEYHSALLALQRLQTDVALAWDGNLNERKGQLDPDAYAVEMMRTERARLSLNQRFADILQRLAKAVFRSTNLKNPLFILPVDDFDLNPPSCLDLLRVLRLISVPRLFTIVLGDLQVAATVLSLKLSNDIGSIADTRLPEQMLAVEPGTIGAIAGDVAANALRKLLPPGQRVELSPMQLHEALNFKPLGADLNTPFLHQLLALCPIYLNHRPSPIPGTKAHFCENDGEPQVHDGVPWYQASLRQLLLFPRLDFQASDPPHEGDKAPENDRDELDSVVVKNAIYSGRQFLSAPPRHIADTWLELYKVTESGDSSSPPPENISKLLLGHFAEVAKAGLLETQVFLADEREHIKRAIVRTISGDWTLRALPIAVVADTIRATAIELQHESYAIRPPSGTTKSKASSRAASSSPRVRILTTENIGWEMTVQKEEGTRRPGSTRTTLPGLHRMRRRLPDTAVSALILYHDLLSFVKAGDTFSTQMLSSANLFVDLAITEWQEQEFARFSWPIPPVRTFLDLDLFKSLWNQAIKSDVDTRESTLEDRVEGLAFAWLATGTMVVTHGAFGQLTRQDPESSWKELTSQLEQLAAMVTSDGTPREHREWLLRVLELLMPEMGLPQINFQRRFNSCDSLKQIWDESRLVIQHRRAERLAIINEVEPALAEELRRFNKGLARGFEPPRHTIQGPWGRTEDADSMP